MENYKQAFLYAEEHSLLKDGKFDSNYIRQQIMDTYHPKWFRDYVSCQGESFSSLSSFPEGVVLRVCRDGVDQTLQVGQMIYKGKNCEKWVLNCGGKYSGWLEEVDADKALAGACFERTDIIIE